jgi:DNA-directed RNA polymerase specialized sigma24 family protein
MPSTAACAETRDDLFASTQWTLLLEAGENPDAAVHAALEHLCRTYWPPIYAYVRRRGYGVEDAEDITQSFFQHIIEDRTLRRASRDRGRFRCFLLGALKICLADDQARRHTLKRGGAMRFIRLDELNAEERHHQQLASDLSPDESLDARWAQVLLDRAIVSMRSDFLQNRDAATFEALSPFLGGERAELSYEEAARHAGVTLSAMKTLIYRLRREFASAVRRQVMQTVSAPHEVEDELRQLRTVFARVSQRQIG